MKTPLTARLGARVPALAAAFAAALIGTAHAEAPPTCRSEVDRLAQTLLARKLPQLCAPCAARLATTLESMYGQRRLPPSLYVSAGAAEWDDPLTRPVMFSGKSLAGVADGDRLAADIDSGYGPRGALRLIYTHANEPIAIATADKQTFIPLAYCVAAPR